MKQSVIAALTVSIISVGAYSTEEYDLLYSGLERRGIFGGDAKTTVTGGSGGRGGPSRTGNGGAGGRVRGSAGGVQRNTGGNGGLIGATTNNFKGANLGQSSGSASGGVVSGNVVNNAGAPMQFGGDMWTSRRPGSININSNSGIGGVGNGGNSGISGNNTPGFTGVGNSAGRGGKMGGDSSAYGNTSADGASSGSSAGGRGGASSVGGGNSSKGGDGSLQFSPSLSVPMVPAKRALERRALELEEEYTWVMYQKRNLEGLELIARFNVPSDDSEELHVRSADSEEELFYAREAEPEVDDEDTFGRLTARDILEAYLSLASDY